MKTGLKLADERGVSRLKHAERNILDIFGRHHFRCHSASFLSYCIVLYKFSWGDILLQKANLKRCGLTDSIDVSEISL